MFKHILVPISRVAEVKTALELAVSMLDPKGVLTLLHVIELVQDMPYKEFKSFYDDLEQQISKDLLLAQQTYEQKNLAINTRVLFGQRVKEILDFSEREQVELIVLQSHPIDLTDPTRNWGTISYRVALLSKCPVMLVK